MASNVMIRVRDSFLGRGLWTGTRVVTGVRHGYIIYKWFTSEGRLQGKDLTMSFTDTHRYMERQE